MTPNEAMRLVEKRYKGVKAVDVAEYQGDYLVRVEFPDAEEKHYDPFFRVFNDTRKVEEFSVVTDGDPEEIMQAFAK